MTTTYKTHYARIDIEELQLLEKHKVSGTCTRVYLALKSFSREKQHCFPSLRTIATILQIKTKSALQTVSKALATLVKLGLIIKNQPNSKKRFFMKAQNEIIQNRQTRLSKNGNITETKNTNSFTNKRNTQKHNKNIIYKNGQKTANKSRYNQRSGFNGGINETYTESDLHPVEQAFSKAIDQRNPLSPDQVKMFQDYITKNINFQWWVQSHHPSMWQKIMCVRLTDDEILLAHKRWNESQNIEVFNNPVPRKTQRINKFGGVFDMLLNQMKMG